MFGGRKLQYKSLSAEASVLIGIDYFLDTLGDSSEGPTTIPTITSAVIQIEGKRIEASFLGASGSLRQAFLWDACNARGNLFPTGAYPYTVELSNDYPATYSGTSIPTAESNSLTTKVTGYAIIQNQRDSVFGSGWGLQGLERQLLQPDGTILLSGANERLPLALSAASNRHGGNATYFPLS